MLACGAVPQALRRAALAVLVAAAVGVSVWRLPGLFRGTDRAESAVAGLTRQERELLPGRSFDLTTQFFLDAAQVIPPGATYLVITGEEASPSHPIVLFKAPVFAGYWLLPRRLTTDPSKADWVVAYGGKISTLGLRYRRVLSPLPGYVLAEVAR
jgi:hypothetical protein